MLYINILTRFWKRSFDEDFSYNSCRRVATIPCEREGELSRGTLANWSGHLSFQQMCQGTQRNELELGRCSTLNVNMLTMVNQRDDTSSNNNNFLSQAQADSLAAFLSDWIEESTAQTSAPHHRPFSPPPPPDIPSGTLRRRSNHISNDGNGNNRAISSRVNSLRTSPRLLHEEEPHLNPQSPNGITFKSSPSCAREVLHRESSTGNGGGMLPLPFAVRRNEQMTQQPPSTSSSSGRLASSHLSLNHQQQVGEVPSTRSAPSLSLMSKSKRATRGSRRHSDPGTLHTATALALHEDIDYLDES